MSNKIIIIIIIPAIITAFFLASILVVYSACTAHICPHDKLAL